MSAEHSQHAPVRLLIAESSENTAQEFDSLLRDAGIPTRVRLVDLPAARDALPTADMMLCNASLPELERFLPEVHNRAPHVPIILVKAPDDDITTSEVLKLGAAHVVARQNTEELVLVFKRELAHVCQSQRLCELNRALKEAEQRCQLLLQSSTAAIAYVHEGMHIHANPGYLKLFGFSDLDALLGLPLMDLLTDNSADTLKQELKRFRQDGEERSLEFAGRATTGASVAGTMTLTRADYDGERCMQVIVRSALAPAETNHTRAAPTQHNGTTANGAKLTEHARPAADGSVEVFLAAAESILESQEPHRVVAVGQIDHFPKLQDEHGLRAAERIGTQIGRVLRENVRTDACVRLGAGQYAFTLIDDDRAQMLDRLESLRKAVEGLMPEAKGKTVRATLSIGGVELDRHSDGEADALLELALNTAFATVRRAAAAGGNRFDVLSKEVAREDPNSESALILAKVNQAIDKQRFVLLFQPIISLRGDSDEHYEVFLRMLDADDRHIAPNEFLRTAIEHGVAAKIDRWVILQSIKMLSAHRSKGHSTRLTINLTANSVADPEFLQWLAVAIKAARLPSDAVIFQITEQDAADQVRQTGEFVEGLRAMHCRASLSRFGVASNPMEILKHIPVDFVKLDGSHIERLAADQSLKDELTAMIRILQGTGKLTIIPMVESAGVLSALWQAGANYVQGHYLQEPSTKMDFDFSTDD